MSVTVLDRILSHKRDEVRERRARVSFNELLVRTRSAPALRPFAAAIRARIEAGGPAVIAEIKRASPSQGVIRPDFDPVAIATSYAAGGATCLSVLTDEQFFLGSDRFLADARAAISLPVLRKDFVVDSYQIVEARALGADCVLLITAGLDAAQLREFHDAARDTGIDALIEVHDRSELDRALALAPRLIGINNRDLKTFVTRLETTYDLLAHVPDDVIVVTESGIRDATQVQQLRARGVNAFLVGEAFMRDPEPGAALRRLFFY